MNEKKRPPGGRNTGTDTITSFQRRHSIMSRLELQELILSFLHSGAENAVPLRDLRNTTGIDGRRIRRAIYEARLRGVPVVSDNEHGYFLPANEGEKARFVRSMRHRAREIAAVAAAVESGVMT